MKLPRGLSGSELVDYLKGFGYAVARQTGGHVRLTTQQAGEHHITVPNHDSLRVGTLSGILSEVAQHFKMTREELLRLIFGRKS